MTLKQRIGMFLLLAPAVTALFILMYQVGWESVIIAMSIAAAIFGWAVLCAILLT